MSRVGQHRQAFVQAPVGRVVGTGRAVEGQERARSGQLQLHDRVRLTVQVAEDHLLRRDAELVDEQRDRIRRGRAQLVVDADRGAGGVVRRGGGPHRVLGVRVQVMERTRHLDHGRLGTGWSGGVVGPHARGQLLDEQVSELRQHRVDHALVPVVRPLVQAGRAEHLDAGGLGHLGQPFRAAAKAIRRPLHNAPAAEFAEPAKLFDRGLPVVQFLAG